MSLSALSESVVAYNIDLYSHLWSYGSKKPSQTPREMTIHIEKKL
ncbi:10033_t:CDS:2 [Rhizophagus irregularis]|nr:10033_t:CDS:2 [Rhizophagus irregularis]